MNDTLKLPLTEQAIVALLNKAVVAGKALETAKAAQASATAHHKAAWAAYKDAVRTLEQGS